MKVKDKFKIKEVREIEKLLANNPDMADDVKTAEVLTILCGETVKAESIPDMDEVELVGLVSDYWLYKKKLNEDIAKKLTTSTPAQN